MTGATRETTGREHAAAYGAITLCGKAFQNLLLAWSLITPWQVDSPASSLPRHLLRNACLLTRSKFRLIPVRSPLLGKSRFLSSPSGTEMFQFPELSCDPYVFRVTFRGNTTERFRIRVSPDRSLVGGSPELIAAVLRPSSATDAKTSTMHPS